MTEPKINTLLGNQYHYNEDKQGFVSAKHERLAEIVHDYDEDLDLVFIKTQVPPEPQYAVIQWYSEDTYSIVSWWREDELDDRILVHIWENDFRKHNPGEIFDQVGARNLAAKITRAKDEADRVAEEWDFVKSWLKSPLHDFKHKGQTFRR